MLTNLFSNIVEITLSTSIIIGILLLFSSKLNKTFIAKWKYFVWLLLAIRLIIPLNFSFPEVPVQLTSPLRNATIQPANDLLTAVAPQAAPVLPQQNLPPQAIATRNLSLLEIFAIIWILGVVAFFLYHIISYTISRKRLLQHSGNVSDPRIVIMLEQLQAEMNISKKITLLTSKDISSPMVLGFFKYYLFLPKEDYTDNEQFYLLRHELVHLKRRDVWYKLALLLSCGVHWFNPLVHFMFKEASKDLEIACDNEVIKELEKEKREEYSSFILDTVILASNKNIPLSSSFKDNNRSLKERFRNILDTKVKRTGAILAVLVIILAGTMGGLVACQQSIENLDDFEYLGAKYIDAPFVAMVIKSSWDSPEQVDPDAFMYFSCALMLSEGDDLQSYINDEYAIMVPANIVESVAQEHFDVSIEHIRSGRYYSPENNAYDFGGLGSAVEYHITGAKQKGDTVILDLKITSASGYPLSSVSVVVEVTENNYKYLSCEYIEAPSAILEFPSASNLVVVANNMTMSSGGETGISSDRGETFKDYKGAELSSIAGFYLEEAIPELGAQGSILENKYADGWAWEGTYGNNKPLRIDVHSKYNDEYIIDIVFENGTTYKISPYGTMIDASLTNLWDLDAVTRAYVWPLIATGGPNGYSWSSPSEISADDLIDICAYNNLANVPVEIEQPTVPGSFFYPAPHTAPEEEVEKAIQKHFDVTVEHLRTSERYNAEENSYEMVSGFGGGWAYKASGIKQEGKKIVLNVSFASNEDEGRFLSNKLMVEVLEDGTVKYISNLSYDNPTIGDTLPEAVIPFTAKDTRYITIENGLPVYPVIRITDEKNMETVVETLNNMRPFVTELDKDNSSGGTNIVLNLKDGTQYPIAILGNIFLSVEGKYWEISEDDQSALSEMIGELLRQEYDNMGYSSLVGKVVSVTPADGGGGKSAEIEDSSGTVHMVNVEDSYVVDFNATGYLILHEGDEVELRYAEDSTSETPEMIFILVK